MIRYKLNPELSKSVRLYVDGQEINIPFDEANRHYVDYLQWLAEDNTPEPADVPEGE